jgi:uncharacterized membrane protein (DUF485 family)
MGAPGSVISLVTHSDEWVVEKLAKRLGVPIQVGVQMCVFVLVLVYVRKQSFGSAVGKFCFT